MKITIHRGINQIGGCITEIATETSKVLIDLGHNLPKGNSSSDDSMANKTSIEKVTENCNAIFYTHYHGDHVDLFKYVPDTVEQYIGCVAKEVMQCKCNWLSKIKNNPPITTNDLDKLASFKTFKILQKVPIGNDIIVIPFMVNHSAGDAYMFLIEAGEKRVLHTGDFREHGYTSKIIETIEKYVIKQPIDVLITEGTMLSRMKEEVPSERNLMIKAEALMSEKKYVFVLSSSTDIDRLATFYNASINRKRSFLCDKYQKEVLDIFSKNNGQRSHFFNFKNVYPYIHGYAEQFNTIKNKGFCMLVRHKHIQQINELLLELPEKDVYFIYSMWHGYLKGENEKQEYLDLWNLFDYEHKEKLHTSGHASPSTLAKVCNLINPTTAIIPIHSEFSENFTKLDIKEELKERIVLDSCIRNNIQFIINGKH